MANINRQREQQSIVYNYDALSTFYIIKESFGLPVIVKQVILVPQTNSRKANN
jgi:hypothetical protein